MTTALRFFRIVTPRSFLFAEDDGTGGGGAPPEPESTEGDSPAGKVMTQADIDKLVNAANARGKASGEASVKSYLEQQNQTAEDQAKTAATAAQQEAVDARKEAAEARVEVAVERALDAAKVPADRRAAAARLADINLETLAPEGKVDTDAVKALVEATITANPFLTAAPAPKTGATGADFTGAGGDGKVWTAAEVDKLSVDEYDKHKVEIMAQMRAGTLK